MEVYGEAKYKKQEECIICLDDIETEWRVLECHHRYHKLCIENWIVIRATCPLCMKNIKDNKPAETHSIEERHRTAVWKFILFVSIIVCVIIVMVICSS